MTQQSTREVHIATALDISGIIDTLKLSFVSDPIARWFWPDSSMYLSAFFKFAMAFGGKAFDQKSAYYVGNYTGAALWLPNGVEPDIDTMMAIMQTTSSKEAQMDGPEVFEKMASFHPHEPHWYLPILGVDPLYHGKGLGSALMGHTTDIFDRENVMAYLESSNPRNISLYKRHGFELLGTIQTNTSPSIFPMLRKPQSS